VTGAAVLASVPHRDEPRFDHPAGPAESLPHPELEGALPVPRFIGNAAVEKPIDAAPLPQNPWMNPNIAAGGLCVARNHRGPRGGRLHESGTLAGHPRPGPGRQMVLRGRPAGVRGPGLG